MCSKKRGRPTLSRVNNYKIMDYIDTNTLKLDIGGNIGFFSSYLSWFVRGNDLIKINEDLVKLGELTKNYLALKNINFYCSDVRFFKPIQKYEFVLSFAIHN